MALVRLVHPFPSILDGLVVAGVALVAGGGPAGSGGVLGTAVRLGLSMTLLQFAIGALNDIVDAPADAGRVPPKPIPGGLVGKRQASAAAVAAVLVGLALAAPSGPGLLVVAVVGLAIGAGYDLVAKGTPWSWLPFAVGIPLLPVYGWYGSTGTLPPFFAVLLPIAILAGAGLAIANARADLETDTAAGTTSVATMLGQQRSWLVEAGLMAAAITVGVVSLAARGFSGGPWALVGAGIAIVAGGIVVGRSDDPRGRARAWEAQAIGAAIAATGWVAAMTLPG